MVTKLKRKAIEKFKNGRTNRIRIIGEVLSDFTIIETALNEVITALYVKKYMTRQFGVNFISDEQFSFALRKSIVLTTLRYLPN